jgi:ribulose-phosphate 3-epimerase
MNHAVKIAPSILAADFARLGEQIQSAEAAGADWIHVDVMDGQFVPNLSMGPQVVQTLRPVTSLPLDVHLMVAQPERFLESFAAAGADHITVHIEATPHIHRALQMIHDLGKIAGVAINPGTPVEALVEVAGDVDLVLVLSVNPGFGGQHFIERSLDKAARVRARLEVAGNSKADILLDGGVQPGNVSRIVAAGGTVLVAGTSVFQTDLGVAGAIANLRQAALRPTAS